MNDDWHRLHTELFTNLMNDMFKKEAETSCALDGETKFLLPNGKTPCGKTPEELFKRKEKK